MNHAELKAKALSNPETLAAYESMDVEFSLLRQMLAAREKAGLSQAQVASRMGTDRKSVV
jgi:hypothetical protein